MHFHLKFSEMFICLSHYLNQVASFDTGDKVAAHLRNASRTGSNSARDMSLFPSL